MTRVMTPRPPQAPLPTSVEHTELNLLGSLVVVLVVVPVADARRPGERHRTLVAVAVARRCSRSRGPSHRDAGPLGCVVIGAMAAAGADVAVSVWPHGRLGTMLARARAGRARDVRAPARRGAARVQRSHPVAVSLLVIAEVACRRCCNCVTEFTRLPSAAGWRGRRRRGGRLVGLLVDSWSPPPASTRLPRGLLALSQSTAVGGAVGYLMLKTDEQFAHDGEPSSRRARRPRRAIAIAARISSCTTPSGLGDRTRTAAALGALLPLCVLDLRHSCFCLAVRTDRGAGRAGAWGCDVVIAIGIALVVLVILGLSWRCWTGSVQRSPNARRRSTSLPRSPPGDGAGARHAVLTQAIRGPLHRGEVSGAASGRRDHRRDARRQSHQRLPPAARAARAADQELPCEHVEGRMVLPYGELARSPGFRVCRWPIGQAARRVRALPVPGFSSSARSARGRAFACGAGTVWLAHQRGVGRRHRAARDGPEPVVADAQLPIPLPALPYGLRIDE